MVRMTKTLRRSLLPATFFSLALAGAALAEVQFRNALDDSPIDAKPIKGEVFTDAVNTFHETGINPYDGNAEAIAAGKEIYEEKCAACHMPDGTGRIGPSLVDDEVRQQARQHRCRHVRNHSLRRLGRHALLRGPRHDPRRDAEAHRLRPLAEEIDQA